MARPGVAGGPVEYWRKSEPVQRLKRRLAELDAALPATADAFAEALAPWVENDAWCRDLIMRSCAAMASDPLLSLPLRLQTGTLVQGLALTEAGGGSAMLAVISAEALAEARGSEATQRLVFDCGYSLVAVIAGEMLVEHWQLDRDIGRVALFKRKTLRGGEWLAVDNRVEQMLIRSAPHDVVVLRLAVTGPARQEAVLEFDTGNGRLLRTGTGDPVASRMLALLALVQDAPLRRRLPLLERLSADGDPMLRWQAMRQWLASDAPAAMARLGSMAIDDTDASVRRAATATLTMIARMQEGRDAA